ncbi:hypothetical protein PAXINDRAFT_16118 [Paxillus involutus ATCC 200175]|uniref:Uncharacterized protein n=1 Tax=Paxillus involutus ATCC 200175 TaxID=664439 RepID=A0A0C9TJQ7_PAXIN|nr:hypothetical protein PAXINDRAFT_16118 [Paxillus involutus ATCC 200175]
MTMRTCTYSLNSSLPARLCLLTPTSVTAQQDEGILGGLLPLLLAFAFWHGEGEADMTVR